MLSSPYLFTLRRKKMKTRLTLITLACNDVQKQGKFYQSFGFQEAEFTKKMETMFFFPMENGVVLGLYDAKALAEDMGGYALGGHSSTIALNVLNIEEQDEMLARWEKSGGKIIRPPFTPPWGGRVAYVEDIEGHPWEITFLEGFPLDERGNLPLK